MTAHELMIKTNLHMIAGGELTDAQKSSVVRGLLAARSDERTIRGFHRGVRYTDNIDEAGDVIGTYPGYFIPPYNGGKKNQTVIPMSLGTHILSANSYELEIVRLLRLFAPDDPAVRIIVNGTLKRLKTACFGNDCSVGECFHASLVALRFIAATAPGDETWIRRLADKAGRHIDDRVNGKKRFRDNVRFYYWLCLSELPRDIGAAELFAYKDEMYARLMKSAAIKNENDKIYRPVLLSILRDCLSLFPEYECLKDRLPHETRLPEQRK